MGGAWAASCKLVLTDNDATRARYPFAFRLEVTYRVEGAALEVEFEITNSGEEMLPASLGGHPAFNWPLLPGSSKEASRSPSRMTSPRRSGA